MRPQSEQSVSLWLEDLRSGEESAAAKVWGRYFQQLVRLAQKHLRYSEKRVEDEEDVALSVLESLCTGAAADRFQYVGNREDLWVLLATMTHRKCVNRIRRNVALKRGGGNVVGEEDLSGGQSGGMSLNDLESSQPTAETLAVLQEDYERLMGSLRNEEIRSIAALRMDGFSSAEIAEKTGLSERSVRRKVNLIRDTWLEVVEGDECQD